MFELPTIEKAIFISVMAIYFAAAIVAYRQLGGDNKKPKRSLIPLIALGVTLESVLLIFRAVEIGDIPLTSLFESMIVLSIVFGLSFLFLSTIFRQLWFSSVMTWLIFLMAVLSGLVAEPASDVHHAVRTPWVVAHGFVMTLSGAAIVFTCGIAALFLVTRSRLKRKQIVKVIGRVPNIEKLEQMNVIGLKACFVFITFGIVTGMGLAIVKAASIHISPRQWLVDPKFIIFVVSWIVLGVVLALRDFIALRAKATAQITLILFFLIIFAIVGSAFFCGTTHVFTKPDTTQVEVEQ